ncbi:MAG: OmpA family protein [Myxococcota bacterium]
MGRLEACRRAFGRGFGARWALSALLAALSSFALAGSGQAQVPLDSSGPQTLDLNAFEGAGFAPSPAAGELDSDHWRVEGLSDGDTAFGDTATTGDFARGLSPGGETFGGVYAFEVSTGDHALGAQPTTDDMAPGSFVLRVRNADALPLTDLTVDYEAWILNNEGRSSSLSVSWSVDGTTWNPAPDLTVTSPETADGTPAWTPTSKTLALPDVAVPPSGVVLLRWTIDDVGGAGSRDELALDDVVLTGGFGCEGDADCDDGDACNGEETCDLGTGACQPGTAPDCDDGVACTDDSCDPATGCVHVADDTLCDDTVACTDDACHPVDGCVYTANHANCDDGIACTDESCNATSGCTILPVHSDCDDGVACTDDVCDTDLDCTNTADDANCDDGLACTDDTCDATEGCSNDHNGSCGDGVYCPGFEVCDDGNNAAEDGCAPDCQAVEAGWDCTNTADGLTVCESTCGDGVVAVGAEECDDGNNDDHDGCRNDCTGSVCGDGVVEYGVEDCDDGNTEGGDGCDADCRFEPGWTCDGLDPTSCMETCGTDFDFTGGAMAWQVDGSGDLFEPGTRDDGLDGFETVLDGDLTQATDTTLSSRVAVPATPDAVAPTLSVHYDLQGDGANDCVEIYVNGNGSLSQGLAFTTCENTATSAFEKDANGLDVARIDLTADAGTSRWVVIRYLTDGADDVHPGLFVDRVTVGSDLDADGSFEFDGQAACDRCIDSDEDGYGHPESADVATCPQGDADCDDAAADVHPGATELCSGGVDDDCDGLTDLADDECDEDCADGVDNGGNGLVDCEDVACAEDDFCDPCDIHWTFESGGGAWSADDLWAYDEDASWATGVDTDVDQLPDDGDGVYFGRLTATVHVPDEASGGPAPTLRVHYRHAGDSNPNADKFAVCINRTDCRFNTPGIEVLASTPTTGFVTGTVDLSDWLGQTITVTLLYDTVSSSSNDNPGVSVDRVRIASDVDLDGLDEGDDATCDPCWDADGDGYGRSGSPDPTQCPLGTEPDCNDDLDGFFVNPGQDELLELGLCGDGVDNDCDGLTDGDDSGCGDEDCANGLDDNGDGLADCADPVCGSDPFCATCSTAWSFDTGEGGWVAQDDLSSDSKEVFEYGQNTTSGALGWETVLNGQVSSVSPQRVRGWLVRDVEVPEDMLAPTLTISYALEGQTSTSKDVFGVCLDVNHLLCDGEDTDSHAFATGTNTGGLATADVPVPADKKGGTVSVVLFYDTLDGLANDNPGVFVESLELHSDVDGDDLDERADASCDHCIDLDGDGYGDPDRPAPFDDVASCSGVEPDCDDDDATTHPGQEEICGDPGGLDNNCDGRADLEEEACTVCGDGLIGVGESCDDGNTDDGDGCSSECLTESGALHLTEIHIPKPNGAPGEQWIELYNASEATIDVGLLGLTLRNLVGTSVSLAGDDCALLGGQTISPGAYYVVAFGSEQGTDGVSPDATCESGFQIAPGGDRLTLEDGSGDLLDQVDFSSGFDCALDQMLTDDGVGRSLVLADAPGTSSKSVSTAWCLAGPTEDYSNSGKHRGTPRAAGGCAEFACDGVDDDCDGAVDQDLPDQDSDGFCDARDCDPGDALCASDCTDADGDGVFDCKDGCLDADGDGYGVSTGVDGAETPACLGSDCNDQHTEVNPLATEGSGGGTCGDALDNDCDGRTDCSDDACHDAANCAGEICQTATALACGDQLQVAPAHDDFPCTDGDFEGGVDAALAFTASADETVTLDLVNEGLNRYAVFIFEGACANGTCDAPTASFTTGCAAGGQEAMPVAAGTEYFVVLDQIGSCAEGAGSEATLRLACGEVCTGGVDEDLDGQTDCADQECVLAPDCAEADFDGDGVDNGVEITCGTSPVSDRDTPTADDVQDLDGDGQLNCTDSDDDGDGTSDAAEASQCPLNDTAKNDDTIYPGAPKNCDDFNVDADCNGTYDLLEAACGGKETACANLVDDDEDGDVDCFDVDCVTDEACSKQDFDGDGISNGFELDCGSDPESDQSVPPGDAADDMDGDDQPNCVDLDDDGDGFPDTQELICGSDHLDPASVPDDTDGDGQCDASDQDDDGDGFDDLLEASCGSDPLDAASTPVDAAHDIDQDGQCDNLDADRDGDGWSNGMEGTCGTDPSVAADNPTASGLDVDGDGLCDAVDDDDDDDGWTDDQEALCGTDPNDASDVPSDLDQNGRCDALDEDEDNDGWSNAAELLCGTDPSDADDNPTVRGEDNDGDRICDDLDSDDDDDGWTDSLEEQCGTDPLDPDDTPVDTDGDGQCDAVDDDDDGDGWLDGTEILCETDPLLATSVPTDEDGDGFCDSVDPEADPDGDGWTTAAEVFCGTDPKSAESTPTDTDDDGTCDAEDDDIDGDGWSNQREAGCGTDPKSAESTPTDTDGDTLCDAVDKDDDADGVPDADEQLCGTDPLDPASKPLEIDLVDTDGDGEVNCVDSDDDGDQLPDAAEAKLGSDPLVADTDGDGLDDGEEDANRDGVTQSGETSPIKRDTDGDGLDDGVEVASCYPLGEGDGCAPSDPVVADTDGDGLQDGFEDADGDGATGPDETSPTDANTDDDENQFGGEATDGLEVQCATDPLDPDSVPVDKDEDGQCDGAQVDSDGDGVADGVEKFCGTDPTSSMSSPSLADLEDHDGDGTIDCADADDDDDGVSDEDERACGTDTRDDTDTPTALDIQDYDGDGILNCADDDDDDDGLTDTQEEALGTDPMDADTDDDGIPDGQETTLGTDPLSVDTDRDGVQDGTEFGVAQPGPDTDVGVFKPDLHPASTTDPRDPDTDGDGVCDGFKPVEGECEANPGEDENGNGRVDEGEGDPVDPSDGLADSDGDGLTDRDEELKHGTDPKDPDTDGDGLDDKLEVEGVGDFSPTDPLEPDTDGGGIVDGVEIDNGTDPNDAGDDFSVSELHGDNFVGCAGGGARDLGLGLLLALGVWSLLRVRRRLAAFLLTALLAGVSLPGGPAEAQVQGNVNIQNFVPGGGHYRVWSVEESLIAPAWRPYGALLYSFENNSLQLDAGEHHERLVESAQHMNLMLGVGLFDHLQLDLHLPVAVSMGSGDDTQAIDAVDGGGLGDMVIRLRGRAIDNRMGGLGLAFNAGVTAPIGDGENFRGDPGVGILAGAIVDWRTEWTVLSFNTGVRIRTEEADFITTTFGNEWTYGLGLEVFAVQNRFTIATEIFGRTPFDDVFGSEQTTTLEALFGPKWWIIPGLSLQTAAGTGLVRGIGTPTFRFMAGLQWAPQAGDADGDGIPDSEDACPLRPEDIDGFADLDGCPDDDNDADGIPDSRDRCPMRAEDYNDVDDDDGCPDAIVADDVDSDGIPDQIDMCPRRAETYNGFEDEDGCPDERPKSPEGGAAPAPAPTPSPEDSGASPDPTPAPGPVVDPDDDACRLPVGVVIPFEPGTAKLAGDAAMRLDRVASLIQEAEDVESVYVDGHADDGGSEVGNLMLSKKRAEAVKRALAGRGVRRSLVTARGWGDKRPATAPAGGDAEAAGRTVGFRVKLGGDCEP